MANKFGPDILIQPEDPEKAAAFYVEQLGFEITGTTPMIGLHGSHINLFIEQGPKLGPVLEVTVDNVQEAAARLVKQGCEIVKDEPDFPRILYQRSLRPDLQPHAIVHQFNPAPLDHASHLGRHQRRQFDFAGFFQPCGGGAQLRPELSRMAHEFRKPFRKALQNVDQIRLFQHSGKLKSREMVGGFQISQNARKARTRDPHTQRDRALGNSRPPVDPKIERPPYPWNAELVRQPRHRFEHRGQQVRVLVSIEMRGPDPRLHDLPDLGQKLLINRQSSPQERPHQFGHSRGQLARGIGNAPPLHKDQMAAHVERRIFAREHDRVIESGAIRHQCGRRQDSVAMRFDYAFVHIVREAEVVRINNQPYAHVHAAISRVSFTPAAALPL
jgi:hypothetical protein